MAFMFENLQVYRKSDWFLHLRVVQGSDSRANCKGKRLP